MSRHGLTTLRRGSTPPPATPAQESTLTVVARTRHSLTSRSPVTDPASHSGGIDTTSEAGVATTLPTITATSRRLPAGYPARDTADNRSTQTRTPQKRNTLDNRHDPTSHDGLTDTALAAQEGQPAIGTNRSAATPLHPAGGPSTAGGRPSSRRVGVDPSTTDDPQRSHRIPHPGNLSAT